MGVSLSLRGAVIASDSYVDVDDIGGNEEHLYSVILTRLTAVVIPTKQESGIIPMVLRWESKEVTQLATTSSSETEVLVWYVLDVLEHQLREDASTVKYLMQVVSCRLFM